LKTLQLEAAFIALWRADLYLANVPIRAVALPLGSPTPYAIITAVHLKHEFASGDTQVADYDVTITVYCGQDQTLSRSISDKLTTLFDHHLFIFLDAYTISCLPDYENPDFAKDTGRVSEDQSIVRHRWNVKLSEHS
jgi:hypothetical protein